MKLGLRLAVVAAAIGALLPAGGADAQTGCPPGQFISAGRNPLSTIFYVKRGSTWYVRGSATSGPADVCFTFGNPGDVGVMGDWDGDGVRSPAVFRPSTGTWYLTHSSFASHVHGVHRYGSPGDVPIAGDWNADGVETLGVFRRGLWLATNWNDSGMAQGVFRFGNPGDIPIQGRGWPDRCCITFLLYRPVSGEYIEGHYGPGTFGTVVESNRWRSGTHGDTGIGFVPVGTHDGGWGVFSPWSAWWQVIDPHTAWPHRVVAAFQFGNPGDEPFVSVGLR